MSLGAAALSLVVIAACSSSDEPAAPTGVAPPATAVPAAGGAATPAPTPAQPAAPAVAAVPNNVPEKIEGANRTMEKATVNGFEASKLQCNTKGGLFAGMAILGGLAAQKQTFEGCAAANEAVRIHFAYDGTKIADIRVADASTPAVASCVAGAVAKTTFPDPCTCVVSFKVGPPAAPAATPAPEGNAPPAEAAAPR